MVRTLLLFLMLAVTLICGGCGTMGPVKPLKKALPNAPQQVKLQQKGTAMLLSWTAPTRHQNGDLIENLGGFYIYRASYDPDSGCPECRPPKNLLSKIDLGYYRSNHSGKRISFWDNDVAAGNGYRYKIVPYTDSNGIGTATTIHRACITPPLPPQDIIAAGLDRQVRLRWKIAANVKPETMRGYNIYRRQGDNYFSPQPLNKKPLTQLRYDDFAVKNGQEYHYALRSVIAVDGHIVESTLSTEVTATPARPVQ